MHAKKNLTFLYFYCSSHHQFYLGNQVHMKVLFCLYLSVPFQALCPFSFTMFAFRLTLSAQIPG